MSKSRDRAKKAARTLEYREGYGWKAETPQVRLTDKALAYLRKHHTKKFALLRDQITPPPAKVQEDAKVAVEPGTSVSKGRGTCPECGKREKVRKDGTMCKHGECAGNGQAAL